MRGFVVAATLLSFPFGAGANPMDITLSRLSYPLLVDERNNPILDSDGDGILDAEDPRTLGGTCGLPPEPGETAANRCAPHQWAFRNLVAQLGRVFMPKLLAPAETLGYNGFYVGLEGTLTPIDDGATFWRLGTEGTDADAQANIAPVNREPDSILFVPTLHVRKGLPFGAEVGTSISYLNGSELLGLGLDVKVAPFEGFFEGVGYLPSLAARGSVTRLTGDDELNLTVVGFDVSLSKAFGAFGQIEITPYLGWQHVWIVAETEVVDFTPERDAWSELNPRWNEFARCLSADGGQEAEIDLEGVPLDTVEGQTEARNLCSDAIAGGHWEPDWVQAGAGNPDDYNNNGVFDREDMQHERGFIGVRVIWEHLSVTGEFALDLTQFDAIENQVGNSFADAATKQWATSLGIGLDW